MNAVFGGLFPYLNVGTEYTFNRTDTLNSQTKQWDQLDTRVGLSIPLNFSKGKTYKLLNIGTNYVLRNEFIKGISKQNFDNVSFSYLHHFITWQQTIQSARQHIYPRLGYTLSLNHRYAISNYNGYQFLGGANLYLPGFHSTHTIVLSGAFQQRDTSNILFSNALQGHAASWIITCHACGSYRPIIISRFCIPIGDLAIWYTFNVYGAMLFTISAACIPMIRPFTGTCGVWAGNCISIPNGGTSMH